MLKPVKKSNLQILSAATLPKIQNRKKVTKKNL